MLPEKTFKIPKAVMTYFLYIYITCINTHVIFNINNVGYTSVSVFMLQASHKNNDLNYYGRLPIISKLFKI